MKRLLLDFAKRWAWAYAFGLFVQLVLSFGCGYWFREPAYLLSIPIGVLLLPNMDRGIWRMILGLPLPSQTIMRGLWFLVVIIESLVKTLAAIGGLWAGLALKSAHPENLRLTAMLGLLFLNIGYRGTLYFALSFIQTSRPAKLWDQLLMGLGRAAQGLGVSAPFFWAEMLAWSGDSIRQWTPALIGLGLAFTIAGYYRTSNILLGCTNASGGTSRNSGNLHSSESLGARPKLSAFPRLMVQSFNFSCSMALILFLSFAFVLWLIKGRPPHFFENFGSNFDVGSLPYFQIQTAFTLRLSTLAVLLTGIRHLRTLPISARRLSAMLVLLAVISIIPFWLIPASFLFFVVGTAPGLMLKWCCVFTGLFCVVQTTVLLGGLRWGIYGAFFISFLPVLATMGLKSPNPLDIPWWICFATTGVLMAVSHGLNERFLKKSSSIYLPRKTSSWMSSFGQASELKANFKTPLDNFRRSGVIRCIMKIRFIAALLLLLSLGAKAASAPLLKINPNKHFLTKEDGSPFFYLGDTAWELFHRLNREDADFYLKNRAGKGFTVIESVVLAEFDGLTVPNAYGDYPLEKNDPTKPVEAYFKHVDYIVNKAQELGLYVGMLPTWGDKWNKKWGVGPEIFTPENAEAYGEFLGKRYRDKAIIWILGGDRNPETDRHLAIIRGLAKGLQKSDGGKHLITYHPQGGGNSSKWFQKDDWLAFNMIQSGHAAPNIPNYEQISANYTLAPVKPTLDGESRYEDHPINWKPENGWFDDWDVRQAAYWSLLAGACGHTFGNHDIWQFLQPDRKPPVSFARTPWKAAIDQPGAAQMGYARRLFESRPYQTLFPDQSLAGEEAGTGADHVQAARAEDRSFAFIYVPTGKPVTVQMNKIAGGRIRVYWFNPRDGTAKRLEDVPSLGSHKFEPPSSGRGNDWLLVLENGAKNFPVPGTSH